MKVFVYGTLKRNGRLHYHMEHIGAKFTGESSLKGFNLHKLCWYPGIVPGDGEVKGEVFEVPDHSILHLDAVEGAPDLFRREEHNGMAVYIYNQPLPQGNELIESGVWPV